MNETERIDSIVKLSNAVTDLCNCNCQPVIKDIVDAAARSISLLIIMLSNPIIEKGKTK